MKEKAVASLSTYWGPGPAALPETTARETAFGFICPGHPGRPWRRGWEQSLSLCFGVLRCKGHLGSPIGLDAAYHCSASHLTILLAAAPVLFKQLQLTLQLVDFPVPG